MKLYRALKDLDEKLDSGEQGVIPRGHATALHWLNDEQIAVLERRGAVAEIIAPPLSELPLSKTALAKFKRAKMDDAGEVLMLSDAELAKKLNTRKATVADWRSEVARLLMVEPPQRG